MNKTVEFAHSQFIVLVGERVRKMRQAHKLSQAQLAELCDIDPASLSRIEAGSINISLLTLYKILRALKLSLADFAIGL